MATNHQKTTFPLRLNAMNQIQWDEGGHYDYVSNYPHCKVDPKDNYVYMEGQTAMYGLYNTIASQFLNLELYHQEVTMAQDDMVTTHVDQVQLPCPVEQESCETEKDGTYLWQCPTGDRVCCLFKTRTTSGVTITD